MVVNCIFGYKCDLSEPSCRAGGPIDRLKRLASTRSTFVEVQLGEGVPMFQRITRTVPTAMFTVALVAGSAFAAGAEVLGATQPADARTAGIACEHVVGPTSGIVKLSSCHSSGRLAGYGTLPGKMFISGTKRSGVIHWTSGNHSYSTTVSATTLPDSSGEYCVQHGYRGEYVVKGEVTKNTDPNIAVGQSVYSVVCISSAGAVKQTHYGSFEV